MKKVDLENELEKARNELYNQKVRNNELEKQLKDLLEKHKDDVINKLYEVWKERINENFLKRYIKKYISDNLNVEMENKYTEYSDSQCISVKIRLDDSIISESNIAI